MSLLSDKVKSVLKETFPFYKLTEEFFIDYKGQKLYFDFCLKDLGILIEVQGSQHEKFIEHFHTDREGFIQSKRRDNLKIDYCSENNLNLLTLSEKDIKTLTKERLMEIIGEL